MHDLDKIVKGYIRAIVVNIQITDYVMISKIVANMVGYEEHTTVSGRDVVAEFPISEAAISSSAAGFSLNTSLPWLASSGSSGSLRLQKPIVDSKVHK